MVGAMNRQHIVRTATAHTLMADYLPKSEPDQYNWRMAGTRPNYNHDRSQVLPWLYYNVHAFQIHCTKIQGEAVSLIDYKHTFIPQK
jgi:hypothetical protein